MFLHKYDEIGLKVQSAIFDAKLMTTPVAVWKSYEGIYEISSVYIFGLRVALINTGYTNE